MLLHETHFAALNALRTPRYELIPIRGAVDQAAYLPRSASVTVTCSPSHGIEPTLRIVEELSWLGYQAIPHVSARTITGDDHLEEIVERLTQAGVQDIYVIGGDGRTPLGPFDSAGTLLRAIHERGNPFEHVGIAGYPEGHPLVEDEHLWEVLSKKQGLASYIVTQMCFDSTAIVRWVGEARRRGIALPVLAGIPGVVNKFHLMRIASRIGVGESAHFLSRHSGMLASMIRPGRFEPDVLVQGLSTPMADPSLDIRGFHIYTFNQVQQTEDWRLRQLSSV